MTEYLDAGNRAAVLVAGHPTAHIVIDPALDRIALEVEWDGAALPDVLEYANLKVDAAYHDGSNWAQLWLLDRRTLVDGYPLLCALADKIQLEGRSFADALPDLLASFKRILEGANRLSRQEEVGLFGELILVEHLLDQLGEHEAIAAWLGSQGAEHDFAIENFDLEVKTTTTEARRHWIGSDTQLVPTPGHELILLSLQLTAGVQGARSLAEQIARMRSRIGHADKVDFDERLNRVGWRDAHAAQYRQRYLLRSKPHAYLVRDTFPAITKDRLALAGLPVERFSRVSYELDLSGIPPMSPAPIFLADLVELRT